MFPDYKCRSRQKIVRRDLIARNRRQNRLSTKTRYRNVVSTCLSWWFGKPSGYWWHLGSNIKIKHKEKVI